METKSAALSRAKKHGFNKSSVVKGNEGYFIAPHGVKTKAGKKAYASCRETSSDKTKCAKISWSVEKKTRK